jgi:hypothetical protein
MRCLLPSTNKQSHRCHRGCVLSQSRESSPGPALKARSTSSPDATTLKLMFTYHIHQAKFPVQWAAPWRYAQIERLVFGHTFPAARPAAARTSTVDAGGGRVLRLTHTWTAQSGSEGKRNLDIPTAHARTLISSFGASSPHAHMEVPTRDPRETSMADRITA